MNKRITLAIMFITLLLFSTTLTQATSYEDDDAFLGDEDAPVTIIEFSDYQCPFCKRFWQNTLPEIKEEYIETGKVRFVYRDFPLTSIHPQAQKAAEAAECVRAEGGDEAYFEMHDLLFENIQSLNTANMKEWADDLGFDIEECLDSGEFADEVLDDASDAQAAGGRGTPFFMINDQPLSGAQPFSAFKQVIDSELGIDTEEEDDGEVVVKPVPTVQPSVVSADADDDAILGDEDAPVTIIEFSDYQCPFCKRFRDQTLPQIKQEYIETGKVRFVYRDFPLTSIHPQAQKAAEAAECVREQGGDGAYFEMHDVLFDNIQTLSESNMKMWAQELGYNIDDCLDSDKYAAEVQADMQDAQAAGGRGTPYFVIVGEDGQGTQLSGAQPFSAFKQAINTALREETVSEDEGGTISDCSGCTIDETCYPVGYRKDGKYCSPEKSTFIDQFADDEMCENNFECSSNVCVSGECVSGSLIRNILRWFGNLF